METTEKEINLCISKKNTTFAAAKVLKSEE
jgi:hypothetical protein